VANKDHPKLVILKRLTALLETITVANGFTHDLAGQVFRCRLTFGDNDPPLFVSINESPRPDFGLFTGNDLARKEDWDLLIQGWRADDDGDLLYALLADVEMCLAKINLMGRGEQAPVPTFPDWYMLGMATEGVVGVKVQPGVVRPAQAAPGQPVQKACFMLPVRVTYAFIQGGVETADTP